MSDPESRSPGKDAGTIPSPVEGEKGGWLRPALFLVLAWSMVLGWQFNEHAAEVRRHREGLERAGQASLGMLEAAIRSMGRGRRQRPEFLEMVFQEVSSMPGIRGTWLTEPNGNGIYAKGGDLPVLDPRTFSGSLWQGDRVLIGRNVDIGECPFDGRGRERSSESMSLPTYLFFSLDAAEMDREIASDLGLRAAIGGAAALAAAGAFLVWRARGRTRQLRTMLAVAEERSRRDREWAVLGAGLAHETKNPLAAVRGIAQRLAGEIEDAGKAEWAREIVDEVDRTVTRLNEFLQFSRPVEPRLEPVELRPLFDEMGRLIEADLAPKRGKLEIAAGAEAVMADRGMLRQILLNLLVNSARAIGEGGRIGIAARPAAEATLSLEVEDDGAGIPPGDVEKVFEPYFSRSPGGTGLGLAIVQRLAEAHGWRVSLESESGAGTKVRIVGIRRSP